MGDAKGTQRRSQKGILALINSLLSTTAYFGSRSPHVAMLPRLLSQGVCHLLSILQVHYATRVPSKQAGGSILYAVVEYLCSTWAGSCRVSSGNGSGREVHLAELPQQHCLLWKEAFNGLGNTFLVLVRLLFSYCIKVFDVELHRTGRVMTLQEEYSIFIVILIKWGFLLGNPCYASQFDQSRLI